MYKVHKILKIFKHLYGWDPTFRFTSRYCNTITVALVAMYYVFIYWTYTISMLASEAITKLPPSVFTGNITVNIGDILCTINDELCLGELSSMGSIKLPIPARVVKFLPSLKLSILLVFIIPLFTSILICCVQVGFFIKETKQHLIEMYKNDCDFVRKAKHLTTDGITASSFHFGGYTI